MSPISKWEIYEYLEPLKEAIDARNSSHKSNKVRQFIRELCEKHSITQAPVDTLFIEFCEACPDIDMKDTYFKTICEKTWETFRVNRKLMINLKKEKRKV